nr:ParM/StbA family protein [Mucilaginibacter oryzae]
MKNANMYTTQSFPSLLQTTNASLTNTANSLLSGLKIHFGQSWYICGNLALNEGQNPRRPLNIGPATPEYQLLFQAALLIAKNGTAMPMAVTVGFPNSTYRLYKDLAQQKLFGRHQIEWDPGVYGGDATEPVTVMVDQVEVLPEIVSCMIALRRGPHQINGAFFVLSLGFGTLETGLSTNEGVVESAMMSVQGVHYAVNIMREELQQTHDLAFKNVQQLNEAFRDGYLFINRKKTDLSGLRKRAIQAYYTEIVSPALHIVISDRNLNKTNRIFLCGGGVYYNDLLECITQEFGDIADIRVAEEPETLAAKGYLLNSLRFTGDGSKTPVGIDMGNIATRVTLLKQE